MKKISKYLKEFESSKKIIAKVLCDYIIKNKDRIIKLDIRYPLSQTQEISSDGSKFQIALTDETWTITFKAKKKN